MALWVVVHCARERAALKDDARVLAAYAGEVEDGVSCAGTGPMRCEGRPR